MHLLDWLSCSYVALALPDHNRFRTRYVRRLIADTTGYDEGIFLYVVLPEELREEQFFEYVAHSSTPNLGRAPDRITEPRQSRIMHFLREQRTNIINEVNGSESDVSGYLFRIFEQAEIATGEFRRSSPDFLYNVVWSKRHQHFDRVAFRNEAEGTFEYMWLPDEVR